MAGLVLALLASVAALSAPWTPAAQAAQHPLALAHARAPFGRYAREVCGPPAPLHAQCMSQVLTRSGAANAAASVSATPAGYGPVDLWSAYKLSGLAANGGSGQTVAIVDAFHDPTAASDLATYRSTYGLSACNTSPCFQQVDQRGGTTYPAPNTQWEGEISLDLDMVSAICPNCHILLVEADDSSYTNLAAAVDEAAKLGATQISNSYSSPWEWSGETALDASYHKQGIAVVAASGDWSYDNCAVPSSLNPPTPCPGVGYPAASQYVTAVGGTSLTQASSTTRGWTESAWSGAGSGCSTVEPKPSWQHDPSCSGRMVTDVSAVADPSTGVAVYSTVDGGWAIYGGTSAASPIIAAFDALIGPAATSPQYPYVNLGNYFDVASGSNGTCTGYPCHGVSGYDGPTGVGTPNGAPIYCPTAPAIQTQPSNQTVTAPGSAQFTASVSNPSTCTLTIQWQISTNGGTTWSADTTDAGNTTNTLTISPTSTTQSGHRYRAVFTNEHGSTNSAAATLTVNAPPTCSAGPNITSSPSALTVTAPSQAQFTASASNAPNCNILTVQWQFSTNGGTTWSADTTDAGNTTNTLTITPTSASQSGNMYRAVFTNEHGSTNSAAATLTVNAPPPPPPPPPFQPLAAPSTLIAPHVSGAALVGATLSVSNGAWTGSPDGYDYAWISCRGGGGACLQVASGPSYATTSADVGGRVYAEVRAHNGGGWSSFAPSDNSISPQSGQPGAGSRPSVVGVGRVTIAGASARVPLSCKGNTGCSAVVTLTVIETFKRGKLIAVGASAAGGNGVTKKTVVLARVAVSLAPGRIRTINVAVNQAGKRLLSKRAHLQAKLTVVQSGRTLLAKTLGLQAKH